MINDGRSHRTRSSEEPAARQNAVNAWYAAVAKTTRCKPRAAASPVRAHGGWRGSTVRLATQALTWQPTSPHRPRIYLGLVVQNTATIPELLPPLPTASGDLCRPPHQFPVNLRRLRPGPWLDRGPRRSTLGHGLCSQSCGAVALTWPWSHAVDPLRTISASTSHHPGSFWGRLRAKGKACPGGAA